MEQSVHAAIMFFDIINPINVPINPYYSPFLLNISKAWNLWYEHCIVCALNSIPVGGYQGKE